MNSEVQPRLHTIPLPPFRVLVVEDDPNFRQQFCIVMTEYAKPYYNLEIHESGSIEEGMDRLHGSHYDGVILDLVLPLRPGMKEEPNLTLNYLCLELTNRVRWVAQLTSYPDDPELKRFWEKYGGTPGFRFAVYNKRADDLLRLARDMLFGEIKVPLESQWLLRELGAVEVPIGRHESGMPEDFDIFKFMHRLGVVWSGLDEGTRKKAISLFAIDPPDPRSTEVKRIGFRSFSCWDSQNLK